jgi:hypothetical protein
MDKEDIEYVKRACDYISHTVEQPHGISAATAHCRGLLKILEDLEQKELGLRIGNNE